MQISRHWRMNAQRYRLEGVRYEDGTVSLQSRPVSAVTTEEKPTALHDEKKNKNRIVHAA